MRNPSVGPKQTGGLFGPSVHFRAFPHDLPVLVRSGSRKTVPNQLKPPNQKRSASRLALLVVFGPNTVPLEAKIADRKRRAKHAEN